MYDFIKQLSFPAQLPVIPDTVFYKKNCSYYVSREYFDSDFLRQMAIFSLSLLLSQAVLWDPDKQHPDIEHCLVRVEGVSSQQHKNQSNSTVFKILSAFNFPRSLYISIARLLHALLVNSFSVILMKELEMSLQAMNADLGQACNQKLFRSGEFSWNWAILTDI